MKTRCGTEGSVEVGETSTRSRETHPTTALQSRSEGIIIISITEPLESQMDPQEYTNKQTNNHAHPSNCYAKYGKKKGEYLMSRKGSSHAPGTPMSDGVSFAPTAATKHHILAPTSSSFFKLQRRLFSSVFPYNCFSISLLYGLQ
jgi:hypothetical protein